MSKKEFEYFENNTITVGDKSYVVKYSLITIGEFEDAYGGSISLFQTREKDGIKFKTVIQLFHAALLKNHPTMTYQDAGELLEQFIEENGDDAFGNVITHCMNDFARVTGQNSKTPSGTAAKK